jgi:hypothetical protein
MYLFPRLISKCTPQMGPCQGAKCSKRYPNAYTEDSHRQGVAVVLSNSGVVQNAHFMATEQVL